MADNEDISNPGITVIGPDSEQGVPVVFQGYRYSWFQPLLPAEPTLSLHDTEGTSSQAAPYPNAGLPLTDGGATSFSASVDGGVTVDMQSIQAVPSAVGYPASNPHWAPDSLPSSPFDDEDIDGIRLLHFSLTLDGQTQSHPDSYHPYSPIQNSVLEGYELVSPSDQGFVTPYFTPDSSPYGSLSPLSAPSPVAGTPSPTSSFASPLNTTPDGELNTAFIAHPYPDYDPYSTTSPGRGRPVRAEHGPSASSSRMSSPYAQPPRRLSRSPHSPGGLGSHLAVPQSALMERKPSTLTRRHTISAESRRPLSHPSSSHHSATGSYDFTGTGVGGVTGGMSLLTIGPDADPPSPNVPTAPPSPSPSGRPVASEAIRAACEGRRLRKAKFKCDICPQTFTAKHNLINHQKAHRGIKDQVCIRCGNAFTASGTLTRHTKTCKGRSLRKF